ncbi:MAG: VCBS repeat-containing protein, partial [Candidatus Saccharimonas sp.]|nr:VCBS repeat-containing protein [Planctomycetaceae bacterium]
MENGPHTKPPRQIWLVAALLTAVAASLVLAFLFLLNRIDPQPGGPREKPTTAKKLTREETLKLLDQRDRAVALLENQEFAKADELLSDLIRQVPDDPFGPRNLTICRELALGAIDKSREPVRHAEMLVKAREALERLAKVEPNSHVPHVLDARISVRVNEVDQAEVSLKKASELAPKSAPVWYDLFLLKPIAPGEAPPAETVEALRKAHELEPDNLFVLKDWLPLLAQLKDPTFADTAEQAKETLQPFAEIIKTHARVDVLDLLDVVAKAARDGQWPLATGRTMAVRNIMVSEAARDERYVKLDSLEYVLQDFGPNFYERADIAMPQASEGIPVTFALAPPEQQPAIPPGVRDLAAIDLDLDGRIDGVTLHGDRLIAAMPLSPKSADEKPSLVNVVLGGDYQRLLAVDLDDDVDAKLKDRPKETAGCQLADPDLIVFGRAGLKLFENRSSAEGPREFIEKPTGDALASLRDVLDVVPADLDLDGDLDFLTVAADGIRLWSNRSNWSFEEITSRSKLPPDDFDPTAAVVCDWDKDTDLDILVAGTNGVGLLESVRHGRFRWRELEEGFAPLRQSTSLLVEQLDDNGSWDVIGGGPNGLSVVLTQTTAAGVVSVKQAFPKEVQADPKAMLVDVRSFDFDNDGARDIMTLSPENMDVWRGLIGERFQLRGSEAPTQIVTNPNLIGQPVINKWPDHPSRVAICDIDRDGDEDLVVAAATGCQWLSNEGGNANGWLDVSLLAQQIKPNEQNYSKRVNHAGIGGTIELKAGSKYQAQVVTGPITHFGLGPQKKADIVRVIWTNGVPRNLIDPEPNLHVCEEQKLVGSCPYLYAWDGEKFSFVTDLLWNAPIGLK